MRPAARPPWSPRWPARTPSAATRRRSARRRSARRPPAGCSAALRRRRSPGARSPPASAPRSSSAGAAAVAAPAHARPRHRPVPGGQLPDLRDGRHPGRLPGGARAGRRPVAARPRRDRPGRRRAGAVPVGQHAGQPDRRARRSRRGGGLGPGPRRAGVQRRVLRRVHLGRPAAHDPRARRSTACVAVHSLSKRSNLAGVRVGFYAGDAELVDYLARCASTSGSWCPARRRPRRSPRWPTTATSTSSATATASASSAWPSVLGALGARRAAARRAGSTSGSGARRRRLGPDRAAGRRGRACVASPGEFYGPAGAGHVRLAVVQPDAALEAGGQPTRRGLSRRSGCRRLGGPGSQWVGDDGVGSLVGRDLSRRGRRVVGSPPTLDRGVWIGVLILVAGLIGAGIWFVTGIVGIGRRINDLPRFTVPGQTTLTLEPGTYHLYAEYPDVDTDPTPAGALSPIVVTDRHGQPISVFASTDSTYSYGAHVGRPAGEFTVAEPGPYTISVQLQTTGFETIDIAIARNGIIDASSIIGSVFGSIALGAVASLVGIILIIVTLVRRNRWRRQFQPRPGGWTGARRATCNPATSRRGTGRPATAPRATGPRATRVRATRPPATANPRRGQARFRRPRRGTHRRLRPPAAVRLRGSSRRPRPGIRRRPRPGIRPRRLPLRRRLLRLLREPRVPVRGAHPHPTRPTPPAGPRPALIGRRPRPPRPPSRPPPAAPVWGPNPAVHAMTTTARRPRGRPASARAVSAAPAWLVGRPARPRLRPGARVSAAAVSVPPGSAAVGTRWGRPRGPVGSRRPARSPRGPAAAVVVWLRVSCHRVGILRAGSSTDTGSDDSLRRWRRRRPRERHLPVITGPLVPGPCRAERGAARPTAARPATGPGSPAASSSSRSASWAWPVSGLPVALRLRPLPPAARYGTFTAHQAGSYVVYLEYPGESHPTLPPALDFEVAALSGQTGRGPPDRPSRCGRGARRLPRGQPRGAGGGRGDRAQVRHLPVDGHAQGGGPVRSERLPAGHRRHDRDRSGFGPGLADHPVVRARAVPVPVAAGVALP